DGEAVSTGRLMISETTRVLAAVPGIDVILLRDCGRVAARAPGTTGQHGAAALGQLYRSRGDPGPEVRGSGYVSLAADRREALEAVRFVVSVDVMPKAGISDPQGQTIERALPTLGFAGM